MIKHTKAKQSKMTLDKLALVVGNGFNEVNQKFHEVHQRIDSLDKKLDEVISTQDKLLKDVEDLKDEKVMDMGFRDRFNKLEKRVLILETKGKK